jgi:hypothetical protein
MTLFGTANWWLPSRLDRAAHATTPAEPAAFAAAIIT